MSSLLAGRIRYWWLIGRKTKRVKTPARYPSMSAADMQRLATSQRSRGKW